MEDNEKLESKGEKMQRKTIREAYDDYLSEHEGEAYKCKSYQEFKDENERWFDG